MLPDIPGQHGQGVCSAGEALSNVMCFHMIHLTHPLVLLGQRWLPGGDHLSRGGGTSRHIVWVWAHLLDWPHRHCS